MLNLESDVGKPNGMMWICAFDRGGYRRGDEVLPDDNVIVPKGKDSMIGRFGLAPARDGDYVAIELIDVENQEQYSRGGMTPRAVAAESRDEVDLEARALWVDADPATKIRHKSWDSVVKEIYPSAMVDSPFEVHCVQDLPKFWPKVGGTPIRWYEMWLRDKGLSETDRVGHEMRTLVEALETAGRIDQLNISSLVCMEVLGHRIQSIVDAYSGGSAQPNWGLAKYYESSNRSVDVVSAPLKRHAARKAKEDFDLQTA